MNKVILTTLVVLFALLATSITVIAEEGLTDNFSLTIDGVEYTAGDTIGIEGGETIPIKSVFTGIEDASDVKMRVWIDGYRSDVSDKTGRFEIVYGSTYTKRFSLTVPSDIDPTEDYSLIVRLSSKTKNFEQEFPLRLQRQSYNLEVLSAEFPDTAISGGIIAVDVVLKNRGMHGLEDVFVIARIPDLGTERKVYFQDIDSQDKCEFDEDDDFHYRYVDCDREDSVERRIYLTIPETARAGVYGIEVEAYNTDSEDVLRKSIIISGEGEISDVLSGVASRAIAVGEEASYDLVIVNSGAKMKVYSLIPEEAKGLIIEVDPVVTVGADSSQTVKVNVKATDSADEGTHTVTVNVESEGELVRTVNFSANVEKIKVASSIVVLTVVLAIVFLVLLIVLVVLLTRKPAAVETEETSYY